MKVTINLIIVVVQDRLQPQTLKVPWHTQQTTAEAEPPGLFPASITIGLDTTTVAVRPA